MEDNRVNQKQQEKYTEEKNRICYSYKELNQNVNKVSEAAASYGSRRKEQGSYTVEDYYALPDDQRVELIDGVFYDMASPSVIHQQISVCLVTFFMNYIRKKGGNCKVFMAPCDVRLDCDDRTIVQPDLLVICDKDKLRHPEAVWGAPDLAVEVLSPSTRKKDMILKLTKYESAGVREYWMIDPKQERILVYDFEHDGNLSIYGFEDSIPVGIYNGDLIVDFREIAQEVRVLQELESAGEE